MKVLLSLFMVFISVETSATVIPYNSNSCMPEIARELRVYSAGNVSFGGNGYSSISFNVDEMVSYMKDFYVSVEEAFTNSRDVIILSELKPLCVGMYIDEKGPNAVAIGKDSVLFGFNLVHDLQADWGIDGMTGIKIILAHEYAHILQNRHDLKFNLILPMLSTKQKELQADCLAGMIMGYHHQDSKVLPESERLMKVLGDHHFVGDHGTYEQRKEAFKYGLNEAYFMHLRGKGPNTTTSREMINACSTGYPSYN